MDHRTYHSLEDLKHTVDALREGSCVENEKTWTLRHNLKILLTDLKEELPSSREFDALAAVIDRVTIPQNDYEPFIEDQLNALRQPIKDLMHLPSYGDPFRAA